jgi:hypothetical protein
MKFFGSCANACNCESFAASRRRASGKVASGLQTAEIQFIDDMQYKISNAETCTCGPVATISSCSPFVLTLMNLLEMK